jgi:hypothetical protein
MLGRGNWGGRNARVAGALGCASVALLIVVATDAVGGSGPSPERTAGAPRVDSSRGVGSSWASTNDRVQRHEALPCTRPRDPINFEIFSAGPAVAGVPLTATVRRCDAGAPSDEAPANYVAYVYGKCKIAEGATGCEPPLQIHTWPACQRSLADYSFEGKPLPHRELSSNGARVVEIDFLLDNRIEVYTKSATIVIFASDSALARKAVGLLRPQEEGKPPVTQAAGLREEPPARLEPPTEGAMKGDLPCQS